MADYPPLKGTAFTVSFPIFDQAGNFILAAVIASNRIRQDAGAWAPTFNAVVNAGEGGYDLTLTGAEMSSDFIQVKVLSNGRPVYIIIETATRQIKDLSFPTVSGRSTDTDATGRIHVDIPDTANGILDLANGIEAGMTVRGGLRLSVAADSGKLSGANTGNVKIRDSNDTKNRIDAITDADGNRFTVVRDTT